ncbi:MAG: flavodoxin domain-containing protein [Eubacteriales bacterium]|nr:flavodoxin domain-containing protein [Eubacteriales bacterium]
MPTKVAMNKIAVIFRSKHHGNTKFLLNELAREIPMDLYEVASFDKDDFSEYAAVGFASGIYAWQMDKSLYKLIDSELSLPQKVFVIYTSGMASQNLAKGFSKKLEKKGKELLGVFGCKGHDSFGPFKVIGGINKGRPNSRDLAAAAEFIREEVIKKL